VIDRRRSAAGEIDRRAAAHLDCGRIWHPHVRRIRPVAVLDRLGQRRAVDPAIDDGLTARVASERAPRPSAIRCEKPGEARSAQPTDQGAGGRWALDPGAPAHPHSPPRADAPIRDLRQPVDRVRCSDLLRAEDDDRAAAAMFYFGYLAAKEDIHVVDVSRISDNTAKVMQLCKAEPGLAVPQAFRQALRPER